MSSDAIFCPQECKICTLVQIFELNFNMCLDEELKELLNLNMSFKGVVFSERLYHKNSVKNTVVLFSNCQSWQQKS